MASVPVLPATFTSRSSRGHFEKARRAVPRATVAAAMGQMTDHTLYAEIADQLHIPLQREGWGEVLADADLRSDAVHANARGYEEFARSLMGTAVAVGLLAR